jgi:hypothetical protein
MMQGSIDNLRESIRLPGLYDNSPGGLFFYHGVGSLDTTWTCG